MFGYAFDLGGNVGYFVAISTMRLLGLYLRFGSGWETTRVNFQDASSTVQLSSTKEGFFNRMSVTTLIEDYGRECIVGFQRSLSELFVLSFVFPRVFQVLTGFILVWLGFCFSDSGRFEVFASL